MLSHPVTHTPYPDVNAVLQTLLEGAQSVLGNHFVGLYLYGSLASGDFNPQTSDVDFLVVADTDLSEELIRDLEALHVRLWNSGLKWAAKLEGAYVPLARCAVTIPTQRPARRSTKDASISTSRAAIGSFSVTSCANTAQRFAAQPCNPRSIR